jgi:hypothetical protein
MASCFRARWERGSRGHKGGTAWALLDRQMGKEKSVLATALAADGYRRGFTVQFSWLGPGHEKHAY